jgi:predicted amidohydrolase
MRPKYSSPGAELLNCSHWRCAHLLLVTSQTPCLPVDLELAVGLGFGEAAGVAAAAGVACCGALSSSSKLVPAIAIDNVGSVRFTSVIFAAMRGAPLTSRRSASMTRSIRVAVAQLQARDRSDFPKALESILDAAGRAARERDLLVLPEGTFPGYVLGRAPIEGAEFERALEGLQAIARETRTVIVAGTAALVDGSVRNAAIVVDSDGSLAGRADKLFLWHFDRRWFDRGERLAPVKTSLGSLGVLICADGRIPTISRALVDAGAQALVMPTAWVTSGRDPRALENVQADLLAQVRAYENRVPFVAANKCGSELGMVAYCGKSQIVDERGEIVAIANEWEPETLQATIRIGGQPPARATPARPPRPQFQASDPVRIAIAYDALPHDIDDRLDLLDDAYAISPADGERLAMLNGAIPLASLDDASVLDPGGLVPYRLAGYALISWTTDLHAPWVERIARARALELRIYLVVFDRRSRRAFAVDPDGTIVAGTFGDYRLASFTFDRRKTQETSVAPGTDIAEALQRIEAMLAVPI